MKSTTTLASSLPFVFLEEVASGGAERLLQSEIPRRERPASHEYPPAGDGSESLKAVRKGFVQRPTPSRRSRWAPRPDRQEKWAATCEPSGGLLGREIVRECFCLRSRRAECRRVTAGRPLPSLKRHGSRVIPLGWLHAFGRVHDWMPIQCGQSRQPQGHTCAVLAFD